MLVQDSQPCLPCQGARQEIMRSDCLNLSHQRAHQLEEPWKALSGFCESNKLVKMDSIVTRPVPMGIQGLLQLTSSINFIFLMKKPVFIILSVVLFKKKFC